MANKLSLSHQNRIVGISYCRLLLQDTMLCNDSHRTGTSDMPICECGLERDTADRFLLRCVRFQDARNKLKHSLNDISELSQRKSRLQLSETVLISPMIDDISRKENKLIKEALSSLLLIHKSRSNFAAITLTITVLCQSVYTVQLFTVKFQPNDVIILVLY